MPPSLRRRAQPQPPAEDPFSDSDGDLPEEQGFDDDDGDILDDDMHAMDAEEDDDDLEDLEPATSPTHLNTAPPPHLREISTLASWTVSSSKPGCSVPQLRSPSTSLFWQSDGPQPHYLNIHFFKLVRIVGLRLYLDFDLDESYTPTRIIFLAGSGNNDLVEWGEMKLEQPRGWVWADFSGVGEPDSDDSEDSESESESEEELEGDGTHIPHHANRHHPHHDDASDFENTMPGPSTGAGAIQTPLLRHAMDPMQVDTSSFTAPNDTPTLSRPTPRLPFASLSANAPPASSSPQPRSRRAKKPKMPVLRAHLVQIKILENHQNGKDTHLRGLQVFAKDNERDKAPKVKAFLGSEGKAKAEGRKRRGRGDDGLDFGLGRMKRAEWDGEGMIR